MSTDFAAELERRAAELPGAGAPWLESLRRECMARFAERGLPTRRDEEWRCTDLAPIGRTDFVPARAVVRVTCPPQAHVIPLSQALDQAPLRVEQRLGRTADPKRHPFVALNTALFDEGVVIDVPASVSLTEPIDIRVEAPTAGEARALHSRILIRAGRGSRAVVVERHSGAGVYLSNVVCEIELEADARLDHVSLQDSSADAFHVAMLAVRQEAGSTFTQHSLAFGGAIARVDLETILEAEGAEVVLNGLFAGRGSQLIDHHTAVDHATSHTRSRELYKGLLDGHARGVFSGHVHVRPHAQQIDAGQTNRNLLLSDDAAVHTKPQLEIHADDVKCAHGASIGRLDAEATFFLRSRGLDARSARRMLAQAFAREVTDALPTEALRRELDLRVQTWLEEGSP